MNIDANWNRNRKWRLLFVLICWWYGVSLFLLATVLVFVACYQNGNREMGVVMVAVMTVTAFSVAWKLRHTLGELRK
jgi:uncharacterized membrane protein YccC